MTGASSGIGAALAVQLAAEGAYLILSARNGIALRAVLASCTNQDRHRIAEIDLSNADHAAQCTEAILEAAGGLDILINNAGIGQRASVMETRLSVDRQIMEVNYFSLVALTRTALPVLMRSKSSMIVSVASVMGKMSTPRRSSYAASKHAVIAFMDALRAELHGTQVKVLSVCPGYIQTPFSIHALKGDGREQGVMDDGQRFGMDAANCAKAIVTAIKADRAECLIGGKEIWGVYLQRFFPALYRWLITKVKVT